MTWPITELEQRLSPLRFNATGRFDPQHALRQFATVRDILQRLAHLPGQVLADEVGMGKTYVALGVAWAAALADRGRNPVVVMIPSSLQQKWPRDAKVFAESCLGDKSFVDSFRSAPTALDFFKLLDDPPAKRARVIFLHHGAFHLTRIDHWTKLALIRRAMQGMHLGQRRDAFPRFAARILRVQTAHKNPDLFAALLQADFSQWRAMINEDCGRELLDDDPVPERVEHVLMRSQFDAEIMEPLRDALRALPARESEYIEERLQDVRDALNSALKSFWPTVLQQARFRSPLLVMDEAHHLRHGNTKLASLFAEESAENVGLLGGALSDRFERMLFLTATPFQLGHNELINVLSRFSAINWKSIEKMDRDQFTHSLKQLCESLDKAQLAATEFDRLWQTIPDSAAPIAASETALECWWAGVQVGSIADPTLKTIQSAFKNTEAAMDSAEQSLRRWVIRHRRSETLPNTPVPRRDRNVGASVEPSKSNNQNGIAVQDEQVLPFLLAARAQSVAARLSAQTRDHYSTFADGLASSYEAFLETSRVDEVAALDDAAAPSATLNPRLQAYVDRMRVALPSPESYALHPKIAPVVARAVELWDAGEKLVVFCHFRRTGHAIVRHISAAIERKLWSDLGRNLTCSPSDAQVLAENFGTRFDAGDKPGAMARYLEEAVAPLADAIPELLPEHRAKLFDVVRRFVRSPIFVARYFDPTAASSEHLMASALAAVDGSGVSLGARLKAFTVFLAKRSSGERAEYLSALGDVQPGYRGERALAGEDPALSKTLLPNIRLANGATKQETRQRLMLSFNTPFFPDILVASSVFSEGVDLHLNCRHVIHHDLSWNPSDIEQRTGRLDRLGSKAEMVGKSIEVYLPYVAETQDEKQFRVVMDRERWFQVLMGEDYRSDDTSIDRLAQRIPLPASAAKALAFELEVYREESHPPTDR